MSFPVAPATGPGRSIAETGESHARERWRLVVWGAVLAIASFTIALVQAGRLIGTGVQHEWNVLFDADPNVYAMNFATGRTIGTWGGRSFFHPNLTDFVHGPILAVAWVASRLGLGSASGIREVLAYLVDPLVAAARVPLMLLLFRGLGLGATWALVLSALDATSFSTRLFASIPESYLLSGTLMALLFWLGVRTTSATRPPGSWVWLAALYVAGGVATLNLLPAGAVLAAALWHRRPGPSAVWRAAALLAAAFALNALTYVTSEVISARYLAFNPLATSHLGDAWAPGVARALWDYPRALANGIMPPIPGMRLDVDPTNHHRFLFTLERGQPGVAGWDPRTLVVLAVIVAGAVCHRRLPAVARPAHGAALGVLALGAVLHGFFGKELLLYTQHWQTATLVIIAGAFYLPRPSRGGLAAGFAALILAVAINNALVLRDMLSALERP